MSAQLKVQIYQSKIVGMTLAQWSYRVVRGARIILTPNEFYALRGGVRRAVRNLATISLPVHDTVTITPLAEACYVELDAENARWKARDRRIVLDQP